MAVEPGNGLREVLGLQHIIGVQAQHVVAAGLLDSVVAGGGRATVRCPQDDDTLLCQPIELPQRDDVGGAVVDNDQLIGRQRLRPDACHGLFEELPELEARDDHARPTSGRR